MFYLIAGLLLTLYYLFGAPKAIKGTLNTVTIAGAIAFLLVLGTLAIIRVIQSPPEIFVGLVMSLFGAYVLRDVMRLSSK